MSRLTALACPLPRDQIDTDALIPVSENTRLSTTGFGDALFASWRYSNIQARMPDPNFILNKEPFDRAQILISGRNFGSGSSRESAVWALRDYGFRAVLAISFNETFLRNCIANGLWPLTLSEADIASLCKAVTAAPKRPITIDLPAQTVTAEQNYSFGLDPYYRRLLVKGLTEDELLARLRPQIDALASQRNLALRP
jgi:3-isopropylmalate/(R)-2-methylmalate dehydratase small subunit